VRRETQVLIMELRCVLKSTEEDDFWNRTRFKKRT
jgi:hypothetical protein